MHDGKDRVAFWVTGNYVVGDVVVAEGSAPPLVAWLRWGYGLRTDHQLLSQPAVAAVFGNVLTVHVCAPSGQVSVHQDAPPGGGRMDPAVEAVLA